MIKMSFITHEESILRTFSNHCIHGAINFFFINKSSMATRINLFVSTEMKSKFHLILARQ